MGTNGLDAARTLREFRFTLRFVVGMKPWSRSETSGDAPLRMSSVVLEEDYAGGDSRERAIVRMEARAHDFQLYEYMFRRGVIRPRAFPAA